MATSTWRVSRCIALAANAAPNTTVNVPGVATITLNRQITAADGTLTVDAIYVNLLSGTQTLTIGTSTCNAASVAPVPVLPGMSLPIGAGRAGRARPGWRGLRGGPAPPDGHRRRLNRFPPENRAGACA